MKRILFVIVGSIISITMYAQTSPTATTKVYDLDLFGDGVIDVFYTADKAGLKFPTQAMWEAAGFDMATINFVRSHVKAQKILDRATRLNSDTYEKRNLWMNLPIGIGKEQGGYPSSNFSDDTFSAWNYTNMFGSWNHGLYHCPAVVGDVGHKNGTDVLAGIKFFESWTSGSGASGWVAKVQVKDENGYGGYAYVRPLVNACIYFGKDGINYNFEDTGYQNCTGFHSACYKYAAECGMKDFHVGLYTSASALTSSNVAYLLGNTTNGQCYDTFLNYSASDFSGKASIKNSVAAAEGSKGLGTCEDVYQGAWIVSMARSWSNLSATSTLYANNKRMNIVLWGEHAQSRFLSYNQGTDGLNFQENYQLLMDRFMSGGYRNPASHPAENNTSDWGDGLAGFQGIGYYIPERSAIKQNLPFTTYFSIGNGDRYNYKGKKTLGSWYNLGQQDVVPTYRWLVYEAGTTTPVLDKGNRDDHTKNDGVPYFTNRDAYIGGSSLRLANKQAIDVILYRAELIVSGSNPTATIAQKSITGPTTGAIKIIVKLKGESDYKEVAEFQPVAGTEWEEQTVNCTGLNTGDVIEYLGFRTTGPTDGLFLGELSLSDDSKASVPELKDATVEVVEECQKSMSMKLTWNVDATEDAWGQIYNQDQNIDHFQILYKDGEQGRVSEVGRTSAWSAYVGNVPMEDSTVPYVGVRAVSTDGKTSSKIQWVKVTRADKSTLPEALSANGNYPSIILDNSSEGLTNALNVRYVEKVAITNSDADFTYNNTIGTPYMADIAAGISDKNADKTNYILADKTIKVHQGQKITMAITIFNPSTSDYTTSSGDPDVLKYCTAEGYADWDCNQGFNTTNDEHIWESGTSNQKKANADFSSNPTQSFTINVPEDAVPGNSRVRIVFSDAWFPHPGAAGATAKGFAIDFPMEITGTNTPREAEVDTHDTGISEDPTIVTPTGISVVAPESEGISNATVDGNNIVLTNVDKTWIYTIDGRAIAYIIGSTRYDMSGRHGTFIVRMQNGNIIRSKKVVL